MPTLLIRLLGRPSITVDGRPGPRPRGRKTWALLAYLVLSERPPSRQRLAELLCPNADDPLGALRWTLADLRRSLGPGAQLGGDPVVLDLGPSFVVDVVADEARTDGSLAAESGYELLEGLALDASPAFESWLIIERHRLSATQAAMARRTALRLLADGEAGRAVRFAARAVERNALDEGNHVLLVRSLAAAGDHEAARLQVELCGQVLRRELGVEPSPALAAAAASRGPVQPSVTGRAAAATQLEAGRAAISAGAIDAGIDCLRRSSTEAERAGDRALLGRGLLALGGALVHAVRGADDEGAVVLQQAVDVAGEVGDRSTASAANRELGFVEVQAGRRRTAELWLAAAEETADTDHDRAAVAGIRGMSASDAGDYGPAFEHLARSVEAARRAGDVRQEAWSLSIEGRARLLRGEEDKAGRALQRSIDLVKSERWLAFLPWPQALHGDLARLGGDVEAAASELEQAWALAIQIGDPCWEGMAARGLALLDASRRNLRAARDWSDEARVRCTRVSDRYQWVHGHVLDATVQLAIEEGDEERAARLVADLTALAARSEMAELLARAQLHAGRLGDRAALDAARELAERIDNPALRSLVASAG